jgi:plasmid stabilization system protein ParE
MAFHVEIQPQAFDDLDSIAKFIKTSSSFATAEKWFNGIMGEIASLEEMPERCPIAPESDDLPRQVRVLLHGRRNRTYKVYFGVQQTTPGHGVVSIYHVRHYARKPLTNEELDELMDDQANLESDE